MSPDPGPHVWLGPLHCYFNKPNKMKLIVLLVRQLRRKMFAGAEFSSIIKMCVYVSLLNMFTTPQDWPPVVRGAGADLNAPDSALPGLRTWGWSRRACAIRPVWVMMAWHLWQLCDHKPCLQMGLMLRQVSYNLQATQHLIFHFQLS